MRKSRSGPPTRRIAKLKPGTLRFRTLDDLDGRTIAASRARSLVAALTEDLGGTAFVSAGQSQLIQRAAILSAYLEDIEVNWVAGQPIKIEHYLKATGVQRRVLTSLGLERRAKDVTPTVEQYLRQQQELETNAEADE